MSAFAPLLPVAARPLSTPRRRHELPAASSLSSRAAPLPCCAARARRPRTARRAGPLRAAADPPPPSEGGEKDDGTASAFQKELQRRRINGSLEDADDLLARASGKKPNAPPRWAEDSRPTPDQLAKSRALSSEGLEGLIPRGIELLRLGFGFFLPFLPFMVAFSVLFTLTFYVFGADFLHGGGYYDLEPAQKSAAVARQPERKVPAYIVPEALLAEPTVDRMVPFRPEQPQ